MANEACNSCLIDQLGFQPQVAYPYVLTYEPPERIYCVDGVPVAPPSRRMFGPAQLDYVYEYVSLSGVTAGALSPSGSAAPLVLANPSHISVYFILGFDATVALSASGMAADGYVSAGFSYSASSPASSGTVQRLVYAPLLPNGGILSAAVAGSIVLQVDAGGSIQMSPYLYWTPISSGASYTLGSALLSLRVFGGGS